VWPQQSGVQGRPEIVPETSGKNHMARPFSNPCWWLLLSKLVQMFR